MHVVETILFIHILEFSKLWIYCEDGAGALLIFRPVISAENFPSLTSKKVFFQLLTPKAIWNLKVKHSNTTDGFCSQLHLMNSIIFCSALITYIQTHSLDLADPAIRTLINSCNHDSWPITECKSLYPS